jgi:hypothetical protein
VVVLIAQLLHFHTVLLSRRQTTYEFVSEVHTTPRPKPRPAPGSAAAPPKARKARSAEATDAAIAAARAQKDARVAAAAKVAAAESAAKAELAASTGPAGEESIEAMASGAEDGSAGQIEVRRRALPRAHALTLESAAISLTCIARSPCCVFLAQREQEQRAQRSALALPIEFLTAHLRNMRGSFYQV